MSYKLLLTPTAQTRPVQSRDSYVDQRRAVSRESGEKQIESACDNGQKEASNRLCFLISYNSVKSVSRACFSDLICSDAYCVYIYVALMVLLSKINLS